MKNKVLYLTLIFGLFIFGVISCKPNYTENDGITELSTQIKRDTPLENAKNVPYVNKIAFWTREYILANTISQEADIFYSAESFIKQFLQEGCKDFGISQIMLEHQNGGSCDLIYNDYQVCLMTYSSKFITETEIESLEKDIDGFYLLDLQVIFVIEDRINYLSGIIDSSETKITSYAELLDYMKYDARFSDNLFGDISLRTDDCVTEINLSKEDNKKYKDEIDALYNSFSWSEDKITRWEVQPSVYIYEEDYSIFYKNELAGTTFLLLQGQYNEEFETSVVSMRVEKILNDHQFLYRIRYYEGVGRTGIYDISDFSNHEFPSRYRYPFGYSRNQNGDIQYVYTFCASTWGFNCEEHGLSSHIIKTNVATYEEITVLSEINDIAGIKDDWDGILTHALFGDFSSEDLLAFAVYPQNFHDEIKIYIYSLEQEKLLKSVGIYAPYAYGRTGNTVCMKDGKIYFIAGGLVFFDRYLYIIDLD